MEVQNPAYRFGIFFTTPRYTNVSRCCNLNKLQIYIVNNTEKTDQSNICNNNPVFTNVSTRNYELYSYINQYIILFI